ncbi:hypothetical protein HU200_024391 [Digitaria exilis]|uniref:Uncharacterized protein n=1 Tax=Digitaria exilis TaxID=1010633 RepID=A0A835CAE7_9POAL|nr:hypothetical protein HU200_024391 [Digitaria exilis]
MFQDQEMGVEEGEPVAGSSAPAGTDQLDLEAAEQLIQLSGGGEDGGSESRSGDSVKSCRGQEKEVAAVESRRRSAGRRSTAAAGGEEDDGHGGEPGSSKGAAESFTCSTVAGVEEKDKQDLVVEEGRRGSSDRCRPARKDRDGGILHGEERRRPKFRSLAAIYRATETRRAAGGGGGQGHADRDPSEGGGERKRKKKKKQRAAGDVLPADAEAISSHAYVS